MKNNYLFSLLFLAAVIILSFGCNSKSENSEKGNRRNNAANQNQNAQSTTNASQTISNQMPPDHANMNHDEMDHSEMQTAPDAKSAPYDLQFLDTMIAHHQGAVVMAKPAAGKSAHDELKKLAENIVISQEKEIAQMREWREKWYAGKPLAMNMEMPGMADSMRDMDMKKLESLTGNQFDLAFIEMMIPHHQGAVTMAKDALEKAEHPEIKTLARSIIMAQEDEIKSMQDWKTKWTKQ